MKRIKEKFFNLSLARQLLILLGFITLTILLVINPFINSRLNSIIRNQTYQSITDSQNQLIDMIENFDDWKYKDRINSGNQLDGNMDVKHILFDIKQLRIEKVSNLPSRDTLLLFDDFFHSTIMKMEESNITEVFSYEKLDEYKYIYYKIKKSQTAENMYWISFEISDISNNLLNDIRVQLLNVLYFVIIIVALVLSLWIYTIINPLKKITNHIQDINHSNVKPLVLNRKDEIGEVGETLVVMETELNRQKKLQSDLIHNISHDLKTPITIIRSYSESMKEDIYPYGDKNSSLDIIIENSDRLEKKVKDFLLLNRLDYIKEKPNMSVKTNLNTLINDIVMELKPLAINLEFDISLKNVDFVGEQELWRSCLTNLLENAIRYAKTIIKIELTDELLSIYNDGDLIEEQLLSEMFIPYTKGKKGNFGLGLSIVHKIVTMYNYSIEVNNIENGVEFKITKKNN